MECKHYGQLHRKYHLICILQNNSAIRMGLAIWKLFKKHLHYACTRGLTEQPQKGLHYNRASTEHKESKITTSNSLRRPELICRNLLLILAKAWSKYTAFTGSWAKVKLLKKKPNLMYKFYLLFLAKVEVRVFRATGSVRDDAPTPIHDHNKTTHPFHSRSQRLENC